MPGMPSFFPSLSLVFALCALVSASEVESLVKATASLAAAPERGAVKVAFAFKDGDHCQMALTGDSVGMLPWDPAAGALEPDDESDGLENALRKRALSSSEKDTAAQLLGMTRTFKGNRRFECPREDGYGFSLWSDSLTLHCSNCFSCSEGVSMSEARTLARLGRLSLWLYRMRDGLKP